MPICNPLFIAAKLVLARFLLSKSDFACLGQCRYNALIGAQFDSDLEEESEVESENGNTQVSLA